MNIAEETSGNGHANTGSNGHTNGGGSTLTTNVDTSTQNGSQAANHPAKESNIDVLIIGAGPAGLMAAAWMAHCGVKARVVDKRNSKIFCGQADGLQCRSLEIFDSLGFGDRAWKEANHMIEICMWNPGEDGTIRRSDRIPDTIVGLSRFQQIVMHQGHIERFFLDNIKKFSHDSIRVERGVAPESLSIDESQAESDDPNAYPVTVKLRTLSAEEAAPEQQATGSKAKGASDGLFRSNLAGVGDENDEERGILRASEGRGTETEVVHAKYVIGCDGARSWTRRALGLELEGEATDYVWGVMDIIPITDFPDIRMRCAIHSANHGSLMVVPRENKLVRLYIQLKEVVPDTASGRADRKQITPDLIFSAAQKILAPYTLDYEYCDWWTAYQIGQRVGNSFSDHHSRVFLAGDAVHTHSPKAGQGMNVSMQDTFNLGWKVGLVVKGISPRTILPSYEAERRAVAQDLIDFDHRFSRLFSGRPAKDVMDAEGVSMSEFKEAFVRGNMFASGLSVDYSGPKASTVVAANTAKKSEAESASTSTSTSTAATTTTTQQVLPTGLPVGMRFNSFQVLNQSCARPWQFQSRLRADGRFRVVLFAGDVLHAEQKARMVEFCNKLDAPQSFIRRATPADAKIDSVVEILTVHSAKRTEVELLRDFPTILHPFDKHTGWDYDKVYVDDESYHEGFGDAYKNYGVDKQRGCVVAVRPDQYVGWVGDLEDFEGLQAYFEGCLVLAPPQGRVEVANPHRA